MLPFKVTVNLSSVLPQPRSAEPDQPPASPPIGPPCPIPVVPVGNGLRGYRYAGRPVELSPRLPIKYPRLTKAVQNCKNLFLCPEAEKAFLALSLPYICLGTADNAERQAEWSELMSQPAITFSGYLE